MGRDEQAEEREVLASIYPDEITDISDEAFKVKVVLEVAQDEGDESLPPPIFMTVTYPEDYPDVAPGLDLQAPPNAPKYKHLDVQDDRARLLSTLEPIIEENLGMAMVFALVSTLKESAELLISERQAAVQALKDVEVAKAEEEENRKFHGTAVTRESFLGWRERFRKEMEEEKERKKEEKELEDKKKKIKTEEKLTGRQLWERGLVSKVDEDEADDEGEDVLSKVAELDVKEFV